MTFTDQLAALEAAIEAGPRGPLRQIRLCVCDSHGNVAEHSTYDETDDEAKAAAALHVAAVNLAPALVRIARAAARHLQASRSVSRAHATGEGDVDALVCAKDASRVALFAALDAAEAEASK